MESAHPSSEGPSNNSSSTDVSRVDLIDPLDPNKTHHLLKHCLSDGQRNEALDHFGTQDVKDAAREISKMGQRELQSKFKLVYGAATHSNNNDWLRRKLYEAIGAAPIKTATKTKVRKPSAKARKGATSADPSFQTNANAFAQFGLERRSRRTPKTTIKGMALAETLKRHHLGSASLPSSPVAGRSVLDMHRFLAHDIATSTSEEESRSWRHEEEEEEDEDERAEGEGRGRPIRQLSSASAVQEPCSVFFPGSTRPLSTGGSLPATTPWRAHSLGLQSSLPRRASSTGLLGLNALGMEYFQNASDVWGSDAWADAALKAAAARRAPSLGLSAEDDGDVMMLPVDLSAFDPAGSLL